MNNGSKARTLTEMVSTIKEEVIQFAQTRIRLFKVELQQKLALLKIATLLGAIAVVLLSTAYLLITLGLVALVAAALADSPYRWVFGFLAVAILFTILGGIAAYFAKLEFALKGIVPRRTIEVLKGDKIWLQSEARNQL
jgi:uncharacterized membrane protein YqjE